MWNKDEVRGKGKQITGTIKDKVGEMTGNSRLEAEGEAEHLKGTIQQKVGKGRRKVGQAIKKVVRVVTGKR